VANLIFVLPFGRSVMFLRIFNKGIQFYLVSGFFFCAGQWIFFVQESWPLIGCKFFGPYEQKSKWLAMICVTGGFIFLELHYCIYSYG
jgi:hypothetical protein